MWNLFEYKVSHLQLKKSNTFSDHSFMPFQNLHVSLSFFFKAKGLDEMIDTTFMYWAAHSGAWVPKLAHQMFAAGLKK